MTDHPIVADIKFQIERLDLVDDDAREDAAANIIGQVKTLIDRAEGRAAAHDRLAAMAGLDPSGAIAPPEAATEINSAPNPHWRNGGSADARPMLCRFRQRDEGRPYPKSSCIACGKNLGTGLGSDCTEIPTPSDDVIAADIWETARGIRQRCVWDSNASVEIVARAIQAERRRCAKVAHAYMHDHGLGAEAADVALAVLEAPK